MKLASDKSKEYANTIHKFSAKDEHQKLLKDISRYRCKKCKQFYICIKKY